MADAFTGEIRVYSFDYAPQDWAFCNGGRLLIDQNKALFSVIKSYYGPADGTLFYLPNLQGTAPMGAGQGTGLTNRTLGSMTGTVSVTLTTAQLPAHTHGLQVDTSTTATIQTTPTANVSVIATPVSGDVFAPYDQTAAVTMDTAAIGATGGGQPHENRSPLLALNFCICLAGVYPGS
ncbi:tail fiber protein [Tistrella mobilis]|uniref:phage tail protein n=1 Tax=Tistrella mobilis TaxID=171437 RepID=UPI0031F67D1B